MVIYRKKPDRTHFLNVDLDIYSRSDLRPLVATLGERVLVLFEGCIKRTYRAHVELSRVTKTPDATIKSFCSLISAMRRPSRDLWNRALRRDFNIGIQAEPAPPYSCEFALAPETIKAASQLGAGIVFTIYAPGKNSTSSQTKASRKLVR